MVFQKRTTWNVLDGTLHKSKAIRNCIWLYLPRELRMIFVISVIFQQSAGIFNHLKAKVMLAIQQDPTPDLNPEILAGLGSLMLAQAQEMFVLKAMHGMLCTRL